MTKTELKRKLKRLGERSSNKAIADLFGIKYQAVQQWPAKEPIPKGRYYELLVKRPDLWGTK